jgi:hypothetical protein
MPEPLRTKITFEEMRAAGVRGLLIYYSDYHCSHWTAISGDRWPLTFGCRYRAEVHLRGVRQARGGRATGLGIDRGICLTPLNHLTSVDHPSALAPPSATR